MQILEGSLWFRKLVKEIKHIDPYLRLVRAKHGFYRIFWKQSYIHEIYKEMPLIGHDILEEDQRIESQHYFEEYEDANEITRKIKNYVEGYWDSRDRIITRVWMLRHDKEFNKTIENKYKQFVVR